MCGAAETTWCGTRCAEPDGVVRRLGGRCSPVGAALRGARGRSWRALCSARLVAGSGVRAFSSPVSGSSVRVLSTPVADSGVRVFCTARRRLRHARVLHGPSPASACACEHARRRLWDARVGHACGALCACAGAPAMRRGFMPSAAARRCVPGPCPRPLLGRARLSTAPAPRPRPLLGRARPSTAPVGPGGRHPPV